MAKSKYDKYFTQECVFEAKDKDGKPTGRYLTSTRHLQDKFGGGHLSVDCFTVTTPHTMVPSPHKHEFPQYLHFFSANPLDARDFDAVIEFTVGDGPENGQKYTITKPTAVYVAAGLYHGPLIFKTINKPVLFVDIAVTAKYSRVENAPVKP
jgi:hypothetical protein